MRVELARLQDEWMRRVGNVVAANKETRRLLQTEYTVPIVAPLATISLADNATGKTPATPWLLYSGDECLVERVYVQLTADGSYVQGRKLAHPDDLFRDQPIGRLWWTIRNLEMQFIHTDGTTRYSPGGSTALVGSAFLTTSYIPSVTTFPVIEQLQTIAIDQMVQIARKKRDDRLAAALAKQMAA